MGPAAPEALACSFSLEDGMEKERVCSTCADRAVIGGAASAKGLFRRPQLRKSNS